MPLRCEGCSQEADRGRAFCAEQQQQSKKKKKKKSSKKQSMSVSFQGLR